MTFINGSGLYFNTIHSNHFKFYEEVNAVIQEEPEDSADSEILGQLASIGSVKGKPFGPEARIVVGIPRHDRRDVVAVHTGL